VGRIKRNRSAPGADIILFALITADSKINICTVFYKSSGALAACNAPTGRSYSKNFAVLPQNSVITRPTMEFSQNKKPSVSVPSRRRTPVRPAIMTIRWKYYMIKR